MTAALSGTSVRVATHGLPWKSSNFHGKCRDSIRGKLCRTKHGNPQKSAAIAKTVFAETTVAISTAIRSHCHWQRGNHHGRPLISAAIATEFSADVQPTHFPRPSVAIAMETRQSPRKSTEVRGNWHGRFRGRPTDAFSTAIRGCPGNLSIRGDYHGIPRSSAPIATKHAAVLFVENSVIPTMPTEVRGKSQGSCRRNCRGTELR